MRKKDVFKPAHTNVCALQLAGVVVGVGVVVEVVVVVLLSI